MKFAQRVRLSDAKASRSNSIAFLPFVRFVVQNRVDYQQILHSRQSRPYSARICVQTIQSENTIKCPPRPKDSGQRNGTAKESYSSAPILLPLPPSQHEPGRYQQNGHSLRMDRDDPSSPFSTVYHRPNLCPSVRAKRICVHLCSNHSRHHPSTPTPTK